MARIPMPPDGFSQRVAKQLVRVTPQIVAPAYRGVYRPEFAFARLSQSVFQQGFMYHPRVEDPASQHSKCCLSNAKSGLGMPCSVLTRQLGHRSGTIRLGCAAPRLQRRIPWA